jgi:(p)ppGpp synthase/HD superfamily hydrolase
MPRPDVPYVVHVATVAAEVIAALEVEPLPDPDLAVTCALLHDTIEDTATTRADVAAAFGDAVADGVLALSKNGSLPKPEQMADSLRRIRAQPREVWAVKLADRIANLAEPPAYWNTDKRRAYRAEAYAIADALGDAHAYLDARLRSRADGYTRYIG